MASLASRPDTVSRPEHQRRIDRRHLAKREHRRREAHEDRPRLEAVRRDIRHRLPYNDVHTRDAWAEKSSRYWVENTGLGFNMVMTIFLGCLVGVVIVAQTLYTSTMEHLREFGTVKAIGGSNADIYRILTRQALIAAVTGFILGVIPSRCEGRKDWSDFGHCRPADEGAET